MTLSLPEIYDAKVASGALHSDDAQLAVLPEFERIRLAVQQPLPKKGWFRKSAKPDFIQGLYLWGGVGRGKSMVMDMFVDSLNVPVRRVHFHAFMQEIHVGMHEARQRGVEDAIEPVAKAVADSVRVLAFDEMQISDITDAMIVGRLFEKLFDAGVVVVTTSNRVPDDLYKNGLNRQLFLPFIELIKERLNVWEMASPRDYRQNRLKGSKVYFVQANTEARADIRSVWDDLTGGVAEPLVLTVKGREVTIPAFRNGIGRARFFDLCGTMLGPGDYLAIADAVKVLILEDIPTLSRTNFNEAKRFVTLIDALYEAKVRLICSAAAEPEMLYLEGEGTFEFERTASRLREMQDENWGRDAD
ncbi:cell division protein ZapE [Shimia thalassica]|jgi:cell division protein ZapE|uniref:cell division protein ZapE n=1 Tax=Shimia thalassica TaxID=1715693 RepID=UPI000C081657|nr:cell division protein ZapE [Shimia thalassica]PHO04631.1 cell division protein ZapE [Rhodobacteraceae bacterium 4F10]MDO6478810.1 cell division protein ZapE [Shimia thalassica]MDO6484466.1 cell division protein ZapE [Shimia thalassica]MDO6797658.1 cell division protein ZapE [Shimia thalassica]MDP2517356.1 cell division protein ZapE [Shimia thalassica]